jgi:hypothetical protein
MEEQNASGVAYVLFCDVGLPLISCVHTGGTGRGLSIFKIVSYIFWQRFLARRAYMCWWYNQSSKTITPLWLGPRSLGC